MQFTYTVKMKPLVDGLYETLPIAHSPYRYAKLQTQAFSLYRENNRCIWIILAKKKIQVFMGEEHFNQVYSSVYHYIDI
jgi:hypothetical protein